MILFFHRRYLGANGRRLLPRSGGRAGESREAPAPRCPWGWKLDVPDPGTVPEPLLIAAALLATQVALW